MQHANRSSKQEGEERVKKREQELLKQEATARGRVLELVKAAEGRSLRLAFEIGDMIHELLLIGRKLDRPGYGRHAARGVSALDIMRDLDGYLAENGYPKSQQYLYSCLEARDGIPRRYREILIAANVPARDLAALVRKDMRPRLPALMRNIKSGKLKPPYNFARERYDTGDKSSRGGARDMSSRASQKSRGSTMPEPNWELPQDVTEDVIRDKVESALAEAKRNKWDYERIAEEAVERVRKL